PEILSAMSALQSLTISGSSAVSAAITQLKEGDLPSQLSEIRVLIDDGKTLHWPRITLPNLRALTVVGELRFDEEQFPLLESLSFRPDRSLRTLRQALALPLVDLHLQLVPTDEEIFELLAARPLHSLGLHGGTKLTTLNGIGALSDLTTLRVKNLRNLSDISGLRMLPRLERLDLQYCTKISNIEVVNDLDSLSRLTLVGCGNVGVEKIQHTIDGLAQRTVGATR
ncbi:hypothetical protein, partial [Microbacterium keratanolyticum]